MVGRNDVKGEIFTLDDAAVLNKFATDKGLGRMSVWSLNRDRTCGANYVTLAIVSDSCSGLDQGNSHFSTVLGSGMPGSILGSASRITVAQPDDAQELADDPATSPYRVWAKNTTYLEGTKVVWHHNVYQAKWWTNGDLPDDAVAHDWQTPWIIIGPVLPGETPLQTQVLAPGLLPEWDGTAIYNKGDLVSLDDVPYRARWWTQGDSPEQQNIDPDSSPWAALTADEVTALTG